jgi:hypothetical protein
MLLYTASKVYYIILYIITITSENPQNNKHKIMNVLIKSNKKKLFEYLRPSHQKKANTLWVATKNHIKKEVFKKRNHNKNMLK